jgi:hypothetical protein
MRASAAQLDRVSVSGWKRAGRKRINEDDKNEARKCTRFVLPISDLSDFRCLLRKAIGVKTRAAIDFPSVVRKVEYDHRGGCS